jgi:hypothetical protein
MLSKTKRGMWTNEALEEAMDAIERGTHSIRKVNKSWNIPMNSFINHPNGRIRSRKMGLGGVFTKEENIDVITWDINNARIWTIH